jgi:hypothetical protein
MHQKSQLRKRSFANISVSLIIRNLCSILLLLLFSVKYADFIYFININLYNCSCNFICIVFIVCSVSLIVCVVLCAVCYLYVVPYCSTTATG